MTHLRVKELGEAQGLTIYALAKKAGIRWPTVASYWNDEKDQFDRRVLDRIASALGVHVADLFGGSPDDTTVK